MQIIIRRLSITEWNGHTVPKINIRHIEAFNAVMKEGSVTKGANALSVTQPAVTKLIRTLEEHCRFKLFNRDTGRLLPTAEAISLYEETSRLADGVARVERAAQSIRSLERGRVTILAFPGISTHLIPRAIGHLLRQKDDALNVSLVARSSPAIEAAMTTRLADFAISLLPTEHPSLKCEPIGHVSLTCAMPAEHPLSVKPAITLDDLNGVPLVSLGRDDLASSAIQAAFMRAGIAMNSAVEVQLSETACSIAAEGVGVAVVTTLSLLSPRHPNLIFRPLREPIKMTLWLITARSIDRSLLSVRFIESIKGEVERLHQWSAEARSGGASV